MISLTFLLRFLGRIAVLTIFCAALFLLHKQLAQVHQSEIMREFLAVGARGLILSFLAVASSFICLAVIDFVAFRDIAPQLGFPIILRAALAGYGISYNLGFSAVTGAATRYRLLSREGLDGVSLSLGLARVHVFFWLASFLCFGSVLLFNSAAFGAQFGGPKFLYSLSGVVCILLVLSFMIFVSKSKRKLTVGGITLSSPTLRDSLLATSLGCMDWALAALALYLLLPQTDLSYLHFLGLFLFAQLGGLISHVPGGLGVFESLLIAGFDARVDNAQLIAALVVFRLVYYILPLLLACSLLIHAEWHALAPKMSPVAAVFSRVTFTFTPALAGGLALVSGLVLLTSGATPAYDKRLGILYDLVPTPVVELSHFLGSIIGMGLIALSRGLLFRLREAHLAALILLALGIAASVFKGLDFEEAAVLLLVFILLRHAKPIFYRKGKLFSHSLSPTLLLMGAAGLALTIWLTLFANKQVVYAHELWWQFAFEAHAARSLRAAAGASALLLSLFLFQLFSYGKPGVKPPSQQDMLIVRQIVKCSSALHGWLAYLGDKYFLLGDSQKSFLMFGVRARSLIVLGDPIGDSSEFRELVWRARELADQEGLSICFYEVGPQYLPLYLDLGLTLVKLGESALIDLQHFSVEGSNRASFRNTIRRLEKEGYSLEVIPRESISDIMVSMEKISKQWLSIKRAKEKGFSLGFFSREYILETPCALVRRDGEVLAFCNLWLTQDRQLISVDLMRYGAEAPKGTMDYMFVKLFLWAKEQGYRRFDLGMAPLSGLENHPLAPLWHKIGSMIFRHGEDFYNFQGLRSFKDKFDPEWVPRYLASKGGLSLAKDLTNITSLVSVGPKGAFKN